MVHLTPNENRLCRFGFGFTLGLPSLLTLQTVLEFHLILVFRLASVKVVLFRHKGHFNPVNRALVIERNCELGSISLHHAVHAIREDSLNCGIFQVSLNLRNRESRSGSDRRDRERRKIEHSTSKESFFIFDYVYIIQQNFGFVKNFSKFVTKISDFKFLTYSRSSVFRHILQMKKKNAFFSLTRIIIADFSFLWGIL